MICRRVGNVLITGSEGKVASLLLVLLQLDTVKYLLSRAKKLLKRNGLRRIWKCWALILKIRIGRGFFYSSTEGLQQIEIYIAMEKRYQ